VPDNPRHHDDIGGTDDLTQIGGIGSKIADRLYAAGILTYADLASRSADEIIKLLSDVPGLSTGRLDSWRYQARELAATAAQAALTVEPIILRAAEPFTMTMTVELPESASQGDRLAYSAVIAARPMAGGPERTVAQSEGLLATASPTITVYGAGLLSGAYRLDGAVSLREPGRDHPVHLAVLAEGLLVRVLPG